VLFRHVGEQYAERIRLKAIFRAQKERTTVADLQDGESIEMQGSGANRDSNKGIVNARYEPYPPLLDAMRELNERAYTAVKYFDARRN